MNCRGSILLSVLLLTGLLAALAAVGVSVQKAAYASSRNFADDIRAELAARAAIESVVARLGSRLHLYIDAGWIRFRDTVVHVTIRDEAARIDLNNAEPELIEGILRVVGVDAEQAKIYAARVVDWRDDDDDPEEGGAERDDYRAAGRVDGPRNGPFLHVAEFALVLGIPPAVAEAVSPYVTVTSGVAEINPLLADRAVLAAVPEIDQAQLRDFLHDRAAFSNEAERLVDRLDSGSGYFTEDNGAAVRVEARVRFGERNERRFEAIITVLEGDNEPYRILFWDPHPPVRTFAGG